MFVDFVQNGRGYGSIGEALGEVRFDRGLLRPFVDRYGRRCVTINTGRMKYNTKTDRYEPVYKTVLISDLQAQGIHSPVFNAQTLRKEDWIRLDEAVGMAARQRLRAWADLAAANSFGGFDGMSKMTLEYEAMSDPGEAVVDMDGLTSGRTDSPLFKLRSIPLPITHSDFWFSSRRLSVSRGGTPLDTTMAEAAGRRVAEMIERTTIGIPGGFSGLSYGGQTAGATAHDTSAPDDGHGSALGASTVYGYTTYPHRLTKTDLTVPTGSNPQAILQDVLEMRSQMYAGKFYGPYMLYHSTAYDAFLDNDYAFTNGSGWASDPSRTLRDRIRAIEGIQDVRRLDFLDTANTFVLVMVQMTADVARAIIGMDITTVQWESHGGMQLNFKVMAIQVPQLRSDYYGNCGILHATTS